TGLLQGVPDRQLQSTDREFSRFIQRDERAALLYKVTNRLDTLFAYAAGVFIRHRAVFRTPSMSLYDGLRVLIGNHDRVQFGPESAAPQVPVVKTSIRKLILLKKQPLPPFVHAGKVALVKPDPGGIQSKPRPSNVPIGCVERKVSLRSQPGHKAVQIGCLGNVDASGGERTPPDVNRPGQPGRLESSLEDTIQRKTALGRIMTDHIAKLPARDINPAGRWRDPVGFDHRALERLGD